MNRHFDDAYEYTLVKLADFDIDDEEDQRLYNRIKDDPRTDQWLKGTHDELRDNRNLLGLGSAMAASGALSAHLLGGRKYAPLTGLLGAGAAGLGIGSLWQHKKMSDYDDGEFSVRRKRNIERFMRNHGSEYGGRRAQTEATKQRMANFMNAYMLSHAVGKHQER